VLSWHVDYWDRLGWKDVYGSKFATKRQRAYAKAANSKRIGTPFFYVNNRPVRAGAIRDLVAKGRDDDSPVRIDVAAEAGSGGTITVKATIGLAPAAKMPKGTVAFPVLVLAKATTKPDAGECKDMTLVEYQVVAGRGRRKAVAAMAKGHSWKLRIPKGDRDGDVSLELLVEDPGKAKTLECVWVPIGKPEKDG